jgi:hypothetical protein
MPPPPPSGPARRCSVRDLVPPPAMPLGFRAAEAPVVAAPGRPFAAPPALADRARTPGSRRSLDRTDTKAPPARGIVADLGGRRADRRRRDVARRLRPPLRRGGRADHEAPGRSHPISTTGESRGAGSKVGRDQLRSTRGPAVSPVARTQHRIPEPGLSSEIDTCDSPHRTSAAPHVPAATCPACPACL